MFSALLAGGKSPTEAKAMADSLYEFYASTYPNFDSKEAAYAAVLQQCAPVVAAGQMTQEQAAAKATEAATAWATVDSMRKAFEAAGGSDEKTVDFQGFLYGALLLKNYDDPKKNAASLYQLWQLNEADPGLTKLLIMEADSLNEKVDSLNGTISSAKKQMDNILGPTADVVGKLADLCKDLDDLDDLLDTADDFGDLGKSVSKKLIAVLDQVDALYQVLDGYEPKLQETLTTVKQLTETAAVTVQDTSSFMGSLEDLMKTSGTQLDDGTKQTLEGLAATLRAAGNSMKKTNDVKAAKSNISSIIEDTWDEYTGDVNNLLLMDANAEAESLTDSRNAAPTTVQVLIRTQEIKADEGGNNDVETVHAQQTTFWGRVAQMFKDLWAAITGIFHKG